MNQIQTSNIYEERIINTMKKLDIQHAFIFDMDGVLFDTERLYDQCWYMAGDSFHIDSQTLDILVKGCVGLNHADTDNFIMTHTAPDFPLVAFNQKIREFFQQILETEGLPVKSGVYQLLEYLNKKQCDIALASSTSRKSILSHLQRSGLEQYFKVIISGDMVTRGKPHPEIYLTAANAINRNPAECYAFEDSYNGIRSASTAGIQTIMIPDLYPETEDITPLLLMKLNSLDEVLQLLKN